jgi:hypothetical protein
MGSVILTDYTRLLENGFCFNFISLNFTSLSNGISIRKYIADSVFDGKIVLGLKAFLENNNMHWIYTINYTQATGGAGTQDEGFYDRETGQRLLHGVCLARVETLDPGCISSIGI